MKFVLLSGALAALVAAPLSVDLVPSSASAQIPIRDLQRNPGVSISGTIRSVVGNEFILDDGTGQIIVDAGPPWYHQLNFQVGQQVTVVGEYDDYDFDAFSITYSNGETIVIRNADGPPPWAGGPSGRGPGERGRDD